MPRRIALLWLACAAPLSAQEAPQGLRYACDAGASRLELAVDDATGEPAPAGATVEWIDVEQLQVFGAADAHTGVRLRVDSRTLERRCGPHALTIRAGFYNANPMGEMGAADAYPIVEILGPGAGRLGTYAMGVCESQNPRYGYLVPCPSDWATRIRVTGPPAVRGTMLELRRTHDERRALPQPLSADEPTLPP